ncbi:MAG: glutamine amidotransferase [Hyphomicrobiales bacterium]
MMRLGPWELTFQPFVGWPVFWALATLAVAAAAAFLALRMRGSVMRAGGLALLLLAIANPQLSRQDRAVFNDIAAVIVDDSESQNLGERRAQTDAALAAVKQQLSQLPGLEVRVGHTDPAGVQQNSGTRMFAALARVMADIPPDRYAGAIFITDGEVHDAPAEAERGKLAGPLHVLLTGSKREIDRRVAIDQAPRFVITGQHQSVTFHVEEVPGGGAVIPVTVKMPDGSEQKYAPKPGEAVTLDVPVTRAGQNYVEISAEVRDGEISTSNNRAVAMIEGIRDRLRVLLISGEPHPGERTWRNMLKADAAVDLVHFTILRPPDKQDGTPTKELSLIAFPTRELFVDKLDQFDLVVFDRYQRQSILPDTYLSNVADYVRKGGAVLISSGPDFAGADGLAGTPLADVLPALPSGQFIEQGFKPVLSDTGQRHPVTQDLPGANAGKPTWGRWFRLIDTTAQPGAEVLMTGPSDKPLLVLARQGEGRVAQFLSDQGWLWARGFEGGGPQVELLRRISHWLMKEPELEEEALSAHQEGGALVVERRSLADSAKPVAVTLPDGTATELALTPSRPGLFTGRIPQAKNGLYALKDGALSAFAVVGSADQKEFAEVRATAEVLAPVATATGGQVSWLEDGVPRFSKQKAGRIMGGQGWMALRDNQQFRVLAVHETPLFSMLASLGVLLIAFGMMWYREGR